MSSSGTPTQKLSEVGVSIWLDDLSRELIAGGSLRQLIDEKNVAGVTTNPTIFASALAKGELYNNQVRSLADAGIDVNTAVFEITTADVAEASRIFRPIYEASNGLDGRVSIEVEPGLAYNTNGTISAAKTLWSKVDQPNAMIKIPATKEGLPAITEVIGTGISVNVTLIFGIERYLEVVDAYLSGLEKAKAAGYDLSNIHSVASFFVSRVDAEIDKRLDSVGTDGAKALKSKAGIANARLAYEAFEAAFSNPRATALLNTGANKQRPLWASTGVKSPDLPDTLYVTELAVPDIVNTMPGKTLEATFDHGVIKGDQVTNNYDDAHAVIDGLIEHGVSLKEVTELLEKEGVRKFIDSWDELLQTVANALRETR